MLPRRSFSFTLGFSLILAAGCDIGQSAKGGGGTGGAGGGTSGSSSGATGGANGSSSSGASSSGSSSGATSSSSSTSGGSSTSSSTSSTSGAPTAGLKVSGNKLVDNGQTVRLLGVDRSGTEYLCIQGNGVIDGPHDQASVTAMKAWKINAVRVPLNEDCWLDINNPPANYSGTNYINPITQWVTLLRQNGLYVILDLHWNNGGSAQSNSQQQMADADHAPAFWASVASTFKGDLGIVFDLYNEPHDISWSCWQNGGCQVNGWNVAGMNQLITAVRTTAGASNVVMAGGLSYSGDLSQWLQYKPNDNNLAASFHSYNFSNCADSGCWSSQLAPVAAQVPIITGELGEKDCSGGADYINGFMNWADGVGVSYLGWTWNADFDNCNGPSLLQQGSNWDGTSPTSPFGTDFKAHLMQVGP